MLFCSFQQGTRREGTMRVQVHTKFCFLCVLTFLFHQCNHCHGQGHSHQHGGHHHHTNHKHSQNHNHSDLQISEAPYMKGATLSPDSKSFHGHSLEEEQRFYIQKLFSRYGQKGRLDFQGFQSLLFSLGLGEVKLVGVDHEDLGHDHVAHLDLLDMQEGLHSHSPSKEGHSHDQGHGHGHPHHKPHHPHTEKDLTGCSQKTTVASPVTGAAAGHDHEHDHGHDEEHNHNHTKVEISDHKHDGRHVQDTHNHDDAHDKEHKQEQSNYRDVSAQPHNDHDHSGVHEVKTGTEMTPVNQAQQLPPQLEPSSVSKEPLSPPATTESHPKRQRKPARNRGQRGRNGTTSLTPQSDDHQSKHSDEDHGHSHAHRDKREAPREPVTPKLLAPVLSDHPGGLSHQHEEVLLLFSV